MGELIAFVPRADRAAVDNLSDFVTFVRKLKVFGAYRQFDHHIWNVTDYFDEKGERNIHWYAFDEPNGNKLVQSKSQVLEAPYLNFAKAYLTHDFALQPVAITPVADRLKALKILELAARQMKIGLQVTDLTGAVFSRAQDLCLQSLSPASIYKVGIHLSSIAEFLPANGLVRVPFVWKSNAPAPADTTGALGLEGDLARAKKLPSKAAIDAIPKIFHICHTDARYDIPTRIATSACAVLMSCPARLSELLESVTDIEVQAFSASNSGYGLRWWPNKGGTSIVKPIPESLVDVVKQALESIREITEPARKLAAWYEQNPGKLYFYPDVAHLADKSYFTMSELGEIMWGKDFNPETVRTWVRKNEISYQKENRRGTVTRFLYKAKDVARQVHSQLPHGFPYFGKDKKKRYSELLFVYLGQRLSTSCRPNRCCLTHYNMSKFTRALTGTAEGEGSIFNLYGFIEADGSPIRANSHQFRHWLNTLMNAAGMSQIDIALLSGRKDIQQNNVYNHLTPSQRVERLRIQVLDSVDSKGHFALPTAIVPISKEEYAAQRIPVAHMTDFGVCFHDYSQEPCQQHRDCLMCNDHVCVKGDEEAERKLTEKLERTRHLLENARQAMDDEEYGADRWVAHNTNLVTRMAAMLDKLRDPDIAQGALIHLTVQDQPSKLKVALEQRVRIELDFPHGVPLEAKQNAQYIKRLNQQVKGAGT
ncbi:hypothetical protein [Ferribacterium limneticum]|uniref:hypothetical protein n=1 Tax=Ferribacterium limneticum TaxID=76259 RepID=UPI001CF89670|nr:hypothetical protein [Ferribacterium limneticum]UCV22312.1 hypothetical protein KI613_17605 [Ferribacterium limneticum]